jgi:DNA gyrase subunit A
MESRQASSWCAAVGLVPIVTARFLNCVDPCKVKVVPRHAEFSAAPTEAGTDSEDASGAIELGEQRYVEMSASEQFVLTISENGFGKRSSSFEYRTTGRGGKGIVAMQVNGRNSKLVASFPVEDSDQIMLVTDKGQLIRCPVEGIRIAGRSTQGVIVFDTAEDEHVVSVEHIGEEENGNGG